MSCTCIRLLIFAWLLLPIFPGNHFCYARAEGFFPTGADNGYETIETQREFDIFLSKCGDNIALKAALKPGVYEIGGTYNICDTLHIIGNGSIVKGAGRCFSIKDAVRITESHYVCEAAGIGPFSEFFDSNGNPLRVSERVEDSLYVNFIRDQIYYEVCSREPGKITVKIPIPENLSDLANNTFRKAFAYVDSWWTSPVLEISHSDSLYLYCTTIRDWFPSGKLQSYINGERTGYRQNARMVVYNTEPQDDRIYYDDRQIYIPVNIDEVECVDNNPEYTFNCKENANICFEDVNFEGLSQFCVAMKGCHGSIRIRDCSFRNILRDVIMLQAGSKIRNLEIKGCEFIDCAHFENASTVYVNSRCCVADISECVFNRYTAGFCNYKNTLECVLINDCDSARILHNTFINFPRGALFIRDGMINVSCNIIFNSGNFNSYPDRNFSRDAGAIYCCQMFKSDEILDNKRNKIELRYNKIYDVFGRGDIRGIFIDDGRGDVECYGNLILNSQCYSIDSRNINSRPYSSIRNTYKYNLVDIPYRLAYGSAVEGENLPVSEKNILLNKGEGKENRYSKNDIFWNEWRSEEGKVYVRDSLLELLPPDIQKMVESSKK